MEAAIRDLKALANRHRFEEALDRSIFGYVNDAVAHGLPRYTYRTGLPAKRTVPR